MTHDAPLEPASGSSLTAAERRQLDRLLVRIARNADAIEQGLVAVERAADAGLLAGLNAVLDEFDENFSATTRPEFMGMVANGMMLLGALSQIEYEPFFRTAMRLPPAVNEAWPTFRDRSERLSIRETISLLRSPEMAALLELLVATLRAVRDTETDTAARTSASS